MTPRSLQLVKEARQVFWPWLLLVLGALLSIFPVSRINSSLNFLDFQELILPFGCFLGIPFLAALPFGSEFQHGTFASLLAQPIDRRLIWLQKAVVTFISVISAVALYVLANRVELGIMPDFWRAAAWMIATAVGASACTLIAKSPIGGLALSTGSFWIVFVVWSRLSDHVQKSRTLPAAFLWATAIALFCYCGGAVWLGRRIFLRLQATDGILGGDILAPSTRILPHLNIAWLRPRSRGPILNLVRRELYLLRLVWLFGLASMFAWTALLAFGAIRGDNTDFDAIPVILAILLGLLIALLAGALSLGEEKNQGTHAWQLTLPLSASVQWIIKLFVALFSSLACAVCMPLIVLLIRGWFAGAPSSYLGHVPVWAWFVQALAVTLIAFWCSCAVKGTVRAILLFFAFLFAMALVGSISTGLAVQAATQIAAHFESSLSSMNPFVGPVILALTDSRTDLVSILAVIAAPLLAVGLIQSHRLFRAQIESRRFHIFRCILPLIALLLASNFVLSSFCLVVWKLRGRQEEIVREAHVAIEAFEVTRSAAPLTQVSRLTVEDLAKNAALSPESQRWLRGSTIAVRRDPVPRGELPPSIRWPYETAFTSSNRPGTAAVPYSATIQTANGIVCNLRFWTIPSSDFGLVIEACR